MTNFVLLNRIFHKSASEPRLLSLESSDVEEHDMSFEEALLDSRLSHILHADYDGAQPPPDTYQKVLLAIEGIKKPQSGERKIALAQRLSLANRLSRAVYDSVLKPNALRVMSGAVTLMVLAVVIGPYLSMVAGRWHGDQPITSPSNSSAYYDRAALLNSDPPDTFAPPKRPEFHFSMREPDPTRGELHKE